MVDWIALLVSHGALGFVFWRLLWRDDLDNEAAPPQRSRPRGFAPSQTADTPGDVETGAQGFADPQPPSRSWRDA